MKPLEEQTPEELIEYIKALRTEAKTNREIAEQYLDVFSRFGEAEQKGLLNMVKLLSEDQVAGANAFRRLANTISPTGDAAPKEHKSMSDSTGQPNYADAPEWAKVLMDKVSFLEDAYKTSAESAAKAQEAEYEQRKAAYLRQIGEMGFKEGSSEYYALLDFAQTEYANGDLDKAYEMYTKQFGPIEGGPEPKADAEAEPSSGKFPTQAGGGSAGALQQPLDEDGEPVTDPLAFLEAYEAEESAA